MKRVTHNQDVRTRRHARVRAKLSGTAERPRLSVFKSNNHIYAQLIDDVAQRTLVAASDRELTAAAMGEVGKRPEDVGFTKVPKAFALGQMLAKKAQSKKISQVAFDRSGYQYMGRIKAVADGARAGGLVF